MGFDERRARAFTAAASPLGVTAAVIFCIGACFGLFGALGAVLTHQVSLALGLFVIALVMLGGAALQIALARRAARLVREWSARGEL